MDSIAWLIVDIVVALAVAIAMLTFFARRNSYRIAVFTAIYTIFYIAILILNQKSGGKIAFVALELLRFVTVFWIVTVVTVYRNDLKIFMSKIARKQSVKFGAYNSYNTTDEQLLIAATEIPPHILDTGTTMDATISSGLLESIFSTKGPLHDGAVVVLGDRIISAGCFLPLSQEITLAKDLGTRHRAAIGITEESDVFAIVVSEETGIISVVQSGTIKRYMTPEKLLEEIKVIYRISAQPARKKKKKKKLI